MANTERVCVYLDGGNFHHLVLKLLSIGELEFSFEKFVQFLANGRIITEYGKRFYVGTVREREGNPRSKQAMARQVKLFSILKSSHWQIKTSKLRTRIERIVIDHRVVGYRELLEKGVKEIRFERMREKGIDVKLATDLIVGAVDNQYDTAIIVSSDGDLVPAIDWVRHRYKKRIEYIGFSLTDQSGHEQHTRPLQTLMTYSDIQNILMESDLKQFKRISQEMPKARVSEQIEQKMGTEE